jgi:sulfur transfer protein SufE
MLLNLLNGHTATEIATYDFHLIKAIDLAAHLSPTRKTGLESVMKRIRELALKYI